jgi:ABC-type enterobactin transport system permease subunit
VHIAEHVVAVNAAAAVTTAAGPIGRLSSCC